MPLILFISFAQAIIANDFAMVGVVLPPIGAQFGIPAASLAGLVAVNALVYASLLMVGGRLADLWGQRLCAMIGLALFSLGTVGVMLSGSFEWLLAARALQGAGSAILAPANFSLLNTVVPDGPTRARGYGIFGAFQGASMISGPLLGGALASAFGWRFAYLPELAVSIGLLVAARRIVPTSSGDARREQFDYPGAVLVMAILVSFVATVAGIGGIALGGGARLASGVLAVLLTLVLVAVERRSRAPLLPLSLIGRRHVIGGAIGLAATMGASTGLFVLPPIYLQGQLGWPAAAAGLAMLPHAIAAMLGAQATAPMLLRLGRTGSVVASLLLLFAALLLYARLPVHGSYATAILLPMAMGGAGSLLATLLLMADAASAVPPGQQGVFSAVAFTSQQIGIAIGSPLILSAAAGAAAGDLVGPLRHGFLIAAAMVGVGLLAALGLRGRSAAPDG